MQIGIIGAGRIGQAVATRLLAAGHEVMLANSRGAETLAELVQFLGAGAHAGTVLAAAAYGDVVVVAVPLAATFNLPVDAFAGRIVVDATNYYPGRDGQIAELDDGSVGSSELLARTLTGARIVKTFNTMLWSRLMYKAHPPGTAERLALALASDDPAAKQLVASLIDDMGFDPVDSGSLEDGRRQEPGAPAYNLAAGADEVRAALQR